MKIKNIRTIEKCTQCGWREEYEGDIDNCKYCGNYCDRELIGEVSEEYEVRKLYCGKCNMMWDSLVEDYGDGIYGAFFPGECGCPVCDGEGKLVPHNQERDL